MYVTDSDNVNYVLNKIHIGNLLHTPKYKFVAYPLMQLCCEPSNLTLICL